MFNLPDRDEEVERALEIALRDFDKGIILEIIESGSEEERFGWGNGAELLNEVTLEEVKRVLDSL